jgi:hypothetical protein
MLELRPNCELCDADLAPDSDQARICTYECTFCARCVTHELADVCPNCGGGFQPRPIRPRGEWRPGHGLAHDPAGTTRRVTRLPRAEIAAFSARMQSIPPAHR